MSTTEIREALRAIEQAVDVPPVDQLAFQARVRAERRRRRTGRVAVGVAAAAVVVAAGIGVDALSDEPASTPVAEVPGTSDVAVNSTIFFVLDRQLTALDPDGTIHDLGQRSEAVVGWSRDRVYALDDESRLRVREVTPPFAEVESPVSGPVQSVVLSGDGHYLAWVDLGDVAHRYDLQAGAEDVSFPVEQDGYVSGVADNGVLVFSGGRLNLRDGDGSIPIPVQNDGFSYQADVARDLVVVNDTDRQSQLYDVSTGRARLLETLPGETRLGPYGERAAVLVPNPDDRAVVQVWDGGTLMPVTGLDQAGGPVVLRWADETTLLVADDRALYACDIDLRCDQVLEDSDISIWE